jgi:hypothetical protein
VVTSVTMAAVYTQSYFRRLTLSADPSVRAVERVGLRPLDCWELEFESRRVHGCLSLVIAMCCQIAVSVMGRFLVQRSPTECAVCQQVRSGAIIISTPTVSSYTEVKAKKERKKERT